MANSLLSSGLFLLLALTARGLAQTPSRPQGTSSEAPAPTFKLQVQKNIVVVRAVVRDKNGRAVAGLDEGDFRVTDDGKPQAITGFSVETSPESTGLARAPNSASNELVPTAPDSRLKRPGEVTRLAAPPAYLVLYFDDLNSQIDNVAWARQAMEKFLTEIPPRTWIAIFTSSGSQRLDFTNDGQRLHETLLKLRSNVRVDQHSTCLEISDFVADRIVNNDDSTAVATVRDEAVHACGMGERTVTDTWVQMQAQEAYDAFMMQARVNMDNLERVVRYTARMPGERRVLLVSEGFVPLDVGRHLERIIDEALHLKVVISALDSKGLTVHLQEADASLQHVPMQSDLASFSRMYYAARETAASGPLADLADGTGGVFVHNTNDLLEGIREALLAPETTYVLAFTPENLKADGKFHTIKVAVNRGRGFSVQTRKGYYAPGKRVPALEEAKDQIREAVFSPDPVENLPLEVQAQGHPLDLTTLQITIRTHIDIRALSFRRESDRIIGKIILNVALFDLDGKMLTDKEDEHTVTFTDADLANPRGSGVSFRSQVAAPLGSYTVRVVARDCQSGAMSALSKTVEMTLPQ